MKNTADFLFEIGCEEIPAGMISRACDELKVTLEKNLTTAGLLENESIEVLGAPRRLAVLCKAIRLKQPDTEPVGQPSDDGIGRVALGHGDANGVPGDPLGEPQHRRPVPPADDGGSDRSALPAFELVGFSGPPSEPDVRLSPHPALHGITPLMRASLTSSRLPMVWGYGYSDSGIE